MAHGVKQKSVKQYVKAGVQWAAAGSPVDGIGRSHVGVLSSLLWTH